MKVANREIISSVDALAEIQGSPLKSSSAFLFARLLLEVGPLYSSVDAARKEIVERYAVKDKKGAPAIDKDQNGNETVKLTDPEAFAKEMDELLNIETTLSSNQMNMSDFSGVDIRPINLLKLEWLISDLDPNKKSAKGLSIVKKKATNKKATKKKARKKAKACRKGNRS